MVCLLPLPPLSLFPFRPPVPLRPFKGKPKNTEQMKMCIKTPQCNR